LLISTGNRIPFEISCLHRKKAEYARPMSTLSSPAIAYYQSVGVDPDRVGKKIGTGTQFEVNLFDDPESDCERVIKGQIQFLSKSVWNRMLNLLTRQSPEQALEEYQLCLEYFDPYIVRTNFLHAPDPKKFALVQDKISFTSLTPELIHTSSKIRDQLEDIFERNGDLLRHKNKWLDFSGMDSKEIVNLATTGKAYSGNVVVVDEDVKILARDFAHEFQYLFQEYNAHRLGFDFTGKKHKQ
jgi:hypothetical protein